ncbi:hypothetical protein C2S52_011343 [Perilla frutescens var. hirtella]|nr:hypothetical protein C2S52_011343 [Perilla frutescens var. hirtella]
MVFNLNLSPSSDSDGCEKAHNSPKIDKDTPKTEDDDGYGWAAEIGCEIESRLEPGSLVEDIDQAYALYCEYARYQPDNKRSNGRLAVYKKQKVHNHELVNPDQSYLLRSARQLCNAKKSILEALHSVGIPVTRACKFMERESGGRQNVGFTQTDAYIHLGRKKNEIKAMYGKEPEVVFSDQCQAFMNGVDYTFQIAAHRLCQCHINQNAPSQFGSLNGNIEFKKLWNRCMNDCETEEEFEEVWQKLIYMYELTNNRWFRNMYNLRTRWSSVFTNYWFSVGLHATSRSEVTNRILKNLESRNNTLYEFVIRYCEVQNEWCLRENAKDALYRGMPGQFLENNPLLTHVARVYMRNIYKIFEYKAHHSMNTKIIDQPHYSNNDLVFEISSSPLSDRTMCVSFNKETHDISCTCRMWESKGVFCRHIFKVLYLMNVEVIPERYILRRWMRECKCRYIPGLNSISPVSVNENLSANSTPVQKIRNPYAVKSREKCVCRTWRKSKLKGPKGECANLKDHSPIVVSSTEFENSLQSPNDYWPEFCRVESQVLSKLDFEQWNKNWIVGDIENNKQEWEERYHQFKWLISRPDVFYYPYDNIVEASVDVWTEISRIRPNLLVYRPKWEPCWEQMRVLFRETIVLSDTHSGGNARSGDPSHNECVNKVVNQPTFGRIAPLLNEEFRINIPKAFYAEKVVRLFERQNNFQFIIGHTHVYWHKQSNEITYMCEETFAELATLTPLAHAYKVKGEPQYIKLCALLTDE